MSMEVPQLLLDVTDLETIDKGGPVRLPWRELTAMDGKVMLAAKSGDVPEIEGGTAPVKGDHVGGLQASLRRGIWYTASRHGRDMPGADGPIAAGVRAVSET